jgi:hypothetical protein
MGEVSLEHLLHLPRKVSLRDDGRDLKFRRKERVSNVASPSVSRSARLARVNSIRESLRMVLYWRYWPSAGTDQSFLLAQDSAISPPISSLRSSGVTMTWPRRRVRAWRS